MKTIKIDGEDYQYQIGTTGGEFGIDVTFVYKGNQFVTDWGIINFIKDILNKNPKMRLEPKKVFTIDFNIEDPSYPKSTVKAAFDKHIKILKRREEIERGEII